MDDASSVGVAASLWRVLVARSAMSAATSRNAAAASKARWKRLVDAARLVLHEHGVERTTSADIAQAADVPVVNVYYYFKTKDELVQAAVEAHTNDMHAMFETFERHRTPGARLKAFLRALTDQRETAARHGCPHGTLCSELDKRDDELASFAGRLIEIPIGWTEAQFRAMGRRDARDLAVAFIAAYQGISLLTNTLRDPDLMTREARRLERWIDTLN